MAQATETVERPASGSVVPVTRRRTLRRLDDSRAFPIMLLVPILIFFLVWNLVPLLWLLGVSFYRFKLTAAREPAYVGFENFDRIWNSQAIWATLARTLIFMVISVGLATILGVMLGLLFWGSGGMPGRRLALTLLFTPMILPPVAVGTFFRLIYEPTFGIANFLAQKVIGQRFDFLGNKNLAFGA